MKHALTMPALSDTMHNGRLAKWLKQPGDPVKTGEAIAEVETDKAIMEVEAFHDGFLAGPLAAVDQELPVGDTIGYITDSVAETHEERAAPAPTEAAGNPAAPPTAETQTGTASAQPVSATEAARAVASGWHARHHHVEAPAGQACPDGLGTGAMIAAAASQGPAFLADGPAYRIVRASSLREAVARNMAAAAATPIFRVTALLPLKALQDEAHDKKLSFTLLLARGCARAIKAHPLFNKAFTEAGLAERGRIDIGIAVDSPDGLITPVLRNVAGRSLEDLSADWGSLKEKVKTRRLAASDYRGATFYLSDLGTFSVVYAFDSIVPAGASAILSIAASRPEGTPCTLSCDHRVIFGGDAARFLQTLDDIVAAPTKLFEED